MASTEADFRTAGARVAPAEELKRRRAMPIDDFIRAYPDFRWSWLRWSSVLVDSAGRVWQPMLSEDGIPYDLESTPEEDETTSAPLWMRRVGRAAASRLSSWSASSRPIDLRAAGVVGAGCYFSFTAVP